jgi:hypothetical protein
MYKSTLQFFSINLDERIQDLRPCRVAITGLLIFLFSITQIVLSQTPTITTRFANPVVTPEEHYCVDVEFISDIPNAQLFGMNVRFFYRDDMLELIGFSDFETGYGAIEPNPPEIITSLYAGPALFNFNGPADYVNGAIQLIDTNAVSILDTGTWTHIFTICFLIDDPDPNEESFCPSLVWDLEQDPANGGFLLGDDGVVMTVVSSDPNTESDPANPQVEQFNWMYTGPGTPPFGIPVDSTCVPFVCPSVLPSIPPDTVCENTTIVFQIADQGVGATYTWNFGSGATPSSATGIGPHNVSYVSTPDNQINGANITMTVSKSGCTDISGQISHVEVNPVPDATISGSTSNLCYYAQRSFQPAQPQIPGATYQWNFGNGAVPPTASGYGAHNVYYPTTGSKTVQLVIYPNDPGAQCPDSSTLTFNVVSCPANITGTVKTNAGAPIGSVNLKLYADVDLNGMPDDSNVIKNVFTLTSGIYSMVSITPGNYVIIESQPIGWISVSDEDTSNDNDAYPNTNPLDDVIPSTLLPGEIDANNNFIERTQPGTISGSVFVDIDGNQSPAPIEALSDVTVKLFHDNNHDGQADDTVAIATQSTSSNGYYLFNDVPTGTYVLKENQPQRFVSVKDFDATNDVDSVSNSSLTDDVIPVSVTNGEHDDQNYFIEVEEDILLVINDFDDGPGSFRRIIVVAQVGDTIRFDSALAGTTIHLTSDKIQIGKVVHIISTLEPDLTVASDVPGLFQIMNAATVEFKYLDLVSGLSTNVNLGSAFENYGNLKLQDVRIYRNPSLPQGQYLIRNFPNSNLTLIGNCFLEQD